MAATEDQIRDLSSTIAAQAQALADGTVTGPRYAAVLRLSNNVETLAAWVSDDRNDHRVG